MRRGRWPRFRWALRATTAAVLAYVVAEALLPTATPLLAPLTALLVIQVTPVSLLNSGLDRVLSVVAGVLLAVGFSTVVPLAWWSLGILIAVSILIGQALRLRENLLEVPISSMLVLGVGSMAVGPAAWDRITETLVGAGVGVAANLLFPPKVSSEDAAEAIGDLADREVSMLRRIAAEIEQAVDRPADVAAGAPGWLEEARGITFDIPGVGAALLRAEESRRLNVRAVRRRNLGPGLRQGLEGLEHTAVSLRSMVRAIHDATTDDRWPDGVLGTTALANLVETLGELADGVETFGQLVRSEALSPGSSLQQQTTAVAAALEGLQEARARLSDLLTLETGPVLAELHFTLLSTVKRVLQEMDLDHRIRRQSALQPARVSPVPTRLRRPGQA